MRLLLQVVAGPSIGKKLELQPGQVAQVGRASWAELSLPHDLSMAGVHFALDCGQDGCLLRALHKSNDTLLNGAKVREAVVNDGDQIVAGDNTFIVSLGGHVVDIAPVAPTAPIVPAVAVASAPQTKAPVGLLALLRALPDPLFALFALFDAARDPMILQVLRNSDGQFESLYEGPKGEEMADFGPWLARLPTESKLLDRLLREGWGKSWGVYCSSQVTFDEVRKHFRKFLKVLLPDGEEASFRFFDPRVLRVFLPTLTRDEAREFFGPIGHFVMEDVGGATALRFVEKQPKGESLQIKLEAEPVH